MQQSHPIRTLPIGDHCYHHPSGGAPLSTVRPSDGKTLAAEPPASELSAERGGSRTPSFPVVLSRPCFALDEAVNSVAGYCKWAARDRVKLGKF